MSVYTFSIDTQRRNSMNALLWALQALLAFWNWTGGIFAAINFEKLKGPMANDLPQPVWIAISVLQVLFAIGLMVPKVTPVAAVYLAVNSLAGCILFAKYAGFPGILWGVIPAAISGFVAYQRM
jgi:uncharacterized membrane protein